jgi:hypothetical protein
MIDLIVIAMSAIVLALLLGWWRWPAFRAWIEAPKYSMLRQERRFDDQDRRHSAPATPSR